MNKQKGNMYPFVTHTWNPIRGKCPHDCSYCYMKFFKNIGKLRLDEKALKDDLGSGNFIFIGSSTDMLSYDISKEQIIEVLNTISDFPDNTYLLQTKNPQRFIDLKDYLGDNIILGTTLETNREIGLVYSKAPPIIERINVMSKISGKKMVTIEPIFDFDVEEFIEDLQSIKPEWINIGADSKGHKLPEPSKEKIKELIDSCKCFTKVIIKKNLKRLVNK